MAQPYICWRMCIRQSRPRPSEKQWWQKSRCASLLTQGWKNISRRKGCTLASRTSSVWTSPSSPASSTPFTTSASNAFPSSRSSSTLSESAPSRLDNPCKSPDWPPDRGLRPWRVKAAVSTTEPFAACVLGARAFFRAVFFLLASLVFAAALFRAVLFFFADFSLRVELFLAGFFSAFFFVFDFA